MTPPKRPAAAQPSAGVRWRSAGTISPQGLLVSGLTPTGGAAGGPAEPDPLRLLGVERLLCSVWDARPRDGQLG